MGECHIHYCEKTATRKMKLEGHDREYCTWHYLTIKFRDKLMPIIGLSTLIVALITLWKLFSI